MRSPPWLFPASVVAFVTHVFQVSASLGPMCRTSVNHPTSMTRERYLSTHCCRAKRDGYGYTVSWSPCETGCCGDPDDNHCCNDEELTSTEVGIIVGCSIAGVVLLIGLIFLFIWVIKKCRSGLRDHADHKKVLEGVYSAKTLAEVFTPAQPLVSAPGTIVHPVTNMNGLYLIDYSHTYVVPPPNQPQPAPIVALRPPGDNHDDEDPCNFGDEDTWEQWDGFPSSADGVRGHSAAGGAGRSAGPGRADGRGANRPYYYEAYDRYTQPPPSYELVTHTRRQATAPSS